MNRPARKLNHLVAKLKSNEARAAGEKLGKRNKRYRKWVEAYKALAEAAG